MAVTLSTAEQAGVAAADASLDSGLATGLANPDTSQNTAALLGYAQTKVFGQPPADQSPLVRAPFRMAWVALVRALASFVEAFTEVGAGGAPAFQNGWGNVGGGSNTCAYYKNLFGEVQLKGTASTAGAVATTVFTLPAGYRPGAVAKFACVSAGALGVIQVDASGNVTVVSGTNTSFSLDGVRFRAVG